MTLNKKLRALQLERISHFIRETLKPAEIPRRRLLTICAVVFVVAVGVRLLHWQNNRLTIDNMMAASAAGYKDEAKPLLEGDLRGFVRGRTPEPDTGLLIHTPGYPIFIAAVHSISGRSNAALRLVQIFISAAAAVIVVLLAAELLPLGAALLAGLFAATSPQLSFYSLVLLPDSPAVFPVLMGVYLLVRARKQPNYLAIIGVGAAIGVACWLRANMVLLPPLFAIVIIFWFPRSVRLRYAALLIMAMAMLIAPITVRNAIVFRNFVPLSLSTGQNLTAGIADYDPEKRFGLERYDHTTAEQEAILYNRPDYARELYRPDGILRERLRVGRAWAVIKANKVWFIGVMARRAGKMLTYEPVAIISAEPSVSHQLDASRGELTWRVTPQELLARSASHLILPKDAGFLHITTTDYPTELTTPPIKALQASDYLLNVPIWNVDGRVVIKIVDAETGRTLASATVPDSLPRSDVREEVKTLQLPFVNTAAEQLKIVVENGGSAHLDAIEVGPIELYRLGRASYLWTKYPRVVIKVLQKYFTTLWMLPLALIGVVLLALARRFYALAIICAVPIYFLCTHAPMHLELRYILPINYFWGIFVATSLYFISAIVWKLLRKLRRSPSSI